MPHSSGLGMPITASPMPMTQPYAGIDAELRQEIAAEPAGRIVHRAGRAVQIAGSEQPDQPVAQILPLQQDEDGDDEDDEDGCERADHRAQTLAASGMEAVGSTGPAPAPVRARRGHSPGAAGRRFGGAPGQPGALAQAVDDRRSRPTVKLRTVSIFCSMVY